MKKEPLFDDHQIRKTKKPNTTEKVHGFILTKKMRKFLDDPKIENVLDKLIELSYKKKTMGYYWFNKVYIKHSNNVQKRKKHNAQRSDIWISLPYTNIVGAKKN